MSAADPGPRQPHHEPAYRLVVDGLTARFEGVLTREDVVAAVEAARAEIEPGSRVHDFLELLVERRALALLRSRSRPASREAEPV